MSYEGATGELSAIVRPIDAVERIEFRSGTVGRLVAPGSATGGRFGLFRWEMPAKSGGAGAHFHRTFAESFYVLSGSVRLLRGDEWVDGRPGDFLFVPEGGIHGFRNDADEAATMLILFTPGAPREAYFRELAEVTGSGRTPSPEEWTELYNRHDQFMV